MTDIQRFVKALSQIDVSDHEFDIIVTLLRFEGMQIALEFVEELKKLKEDK